MQERKIRDHMTQEERLDYLLTQFKEDSGQYREWETGDNPEEKRMALRSLMNIRMPRELPEEVLRQQDLFLRQEALEKGIVELSDIPTVKERYGTAGKCGDRISLWQGDITRLKVGAIVNAANSQMLGCFVPCHRCIDNAIHSAAGVQLRAECHQLMGRKRMRYGRDYEEPVGQAVLTGGYNLPADRVIHTVGPIVYGELTQKHCAQLADCYRSCLQLAAGNGLKSIAFCCISTGEFHFPKEAAARIAIDTVTEFLERDAGLERVVFNVFKEEDMDIYRGLLAGGKC